MLRRCVTQYTAAFYERDPFNVNPREAHLRRDISASDVTDTRGRG